MAAVAGTETITISINGVDVEVPKGELIVESVKRLGLEIPIFCYHPRMKPVGMCRMCLVEVGFKQQDGSVRMMPKPQAGCTLPASENMVVLTDSEMVHRDRKGVLEFLLINHPLDCPICDRGGECPLQNNTLYYGPSTSRFVELKRHLPKAFPLSQYVTLDLERCIQCGRCVRFTEEISGDSQLAFRFRGASMQPSTFQLTDFESKFSGNVIEICPVGALTSAKYRFRARPWDLETNPAICTLCSNGCNIWFDHRVGKLVRINGRTNEAVNEEWTCDRGKFGHDFYNSPNRLTQPLIRKENELVPCSWAEAFEAILEGFQGKGNEVGALAGGSLSNESLFMLQRTFRTHFDSNNLDHRWTKTLPSIDDRLDRKMGVSSVQTRLAAFEAKTNLLLFGTSLADEEPILFLRVRKAWFNNAAKVVVASAERTDADSFAHLVLRYKPGTEKALAAGLLAAAVKSGKATVPKPVADQLKPATPEKTAEITGVPAERIVEAANLIGQHGAIVSTTALYDVPEAQDTLELLAGLAMTTGAEFNCFAREANEQGAEDLGFLPDSLPGHRSILEGLGPKKPGLGTHGMLKGCAEGTVKALWLAGVDPFAKAADREIVQAALENVEFLVVQDVVETEATAYASVVLPMAAPAECDGTMTNLERRVQRMRPAIPARGEAKPAWRTFADLNVRIKPATPFFNAGEIMAEIGRTVPWFAPADYANLDGEGVVVAPSAKGPAEGKVEDAE
ncbi:MAG: NADH-quinone oxidoreductase subunit NuoG [Fimbriimonadaceae bacterium]|nr:NADH-quinone oxidoreductase subunit NuoG [Chthonomonadaceae bacterium]MCO5295579.1 NADH-quinone oxidoreductase subunit NuoG [Fimbriimonadaceae bacterium]